MFEQFWKLYPRKVAKRDAQKAFNKLNVKEQYDAIKAIENHIKHWTLRETESQFIPHPSTWLNQGRWEDELDFTVKEVKPKEVKTLERDKQARSTAKWFDSVAGVMEKGKEMGIDGSDCQTIGQYEDKIRKALGGQENNLYTSSIFGNLVGTKQAH
jgi:hypothetical protein